METWSREQWKEIVEQSALAVYYLYTPICGTCAVASKMMEVVQAVKKDVPMGKADLNYVEDLAVDYEIESVPCLLIAKNGEVSEKLYAFESVPNILEKMN